MPKKESVILQTLAGHNSHHLPGVMQPPHTETTAGSCPENVISYSSNNVPIHHEATGCQPAGMVAPPAPAAAAAAATATATRDKAVVICNCINILDPHGSQENSAR